MAIEDWGTKDNYSFASSNNPNITVYENLNKLEIVVSKNNQETATEIRNRIAPTLPPGTELSDEQDGSNGEVILIKPNEITLGALRDAVLQVL